MLSDFLIPSRDIARIERIMQDAVKPTHGLLREVADYMQLTGGKKLRPRIVVLAARAMTAPGAPSLDQERVLRVAAAVELVHIASLLHDDVIDRATERRGRPSVNARFGDDVAILMADLLFAEVFDLALSALDPQVTRLMCAATRRMCKGEILSIERRGEILSRDAYYSIIDSKTASLFGLCAELGAALAETSPARRDAMARFGNLLGMAFQITDDVLDYVATDALWGKPSGNDLAQGKQTLPLIVAWERAPAPERDLIWSVLQNGREMAKVLPIIKKYDGLEFSRAQAVEFARQAEELIPALEPSVSPDLFRDLCRYSVERRF